MDLEQQPQEDEQQQQQQQQQNDGPRRPRLQSFTLSSLPVPLQGPGPLDLDVLSQPHEVLPQPESGQEPPIGNALSTLLGPAAPSCPLLQQLQEDATNLNESIGPLPIAPLPTFVGVPLPVAIEISQDSETPPASVSLTVLQQPQDAPGDRQEGFGEGLAAEESLEGSGLMQHAQHCTPPEAPEGGAERALSSRGPLLTFFLGKTEGGGLLQLPLTEVIDTEGVPSFNSPASAPPVLLASGSLGAAASPAEVSRTHHCVNSIFRPAYEMESHRGSPGTPGVVVEGRTTPTSYVFLPGGPPGGSLGRGSSVGQRRDGGNAWNGGFLGAPDGHSTDASRSRRSIPAESQGIRGCWVIPSFPDSGVAGQASGSVSTAAAGYTAAGTSVTPSAASPGGGRGCAKKALEDRDPQGLPAGVFAAQAVACAIALVYGVQINSTAILVTNATGFLVELCWISVWASALQQQNESRPIPRARAADGSSSDGPSTWLKRAVGTVPSSASPRSSGSNLQRRDLQRIPRTKSALNTIASPRLVGPPSSGHGSRSGLPPKGVVSATAARSKRPFQQQHGVAPAGSVAKGPFNGAAASSVSLKHSGSMGSLLNRMSASNSSSEGTGYNSGSSNLPREADSMNSSRRNSRPRRRRGQPEEFGSPLSLSVLLCCVRWFGLLLFLSAPLFLFLLLLPVTLVAWLQVPASFCLFGAHIPRLCFMIRAKAHECLPLPLILMGILCNACWALLAYLTDLAAVCCVAVVGYLFSALQMHVIWWSKGFITCIDFDFLGGQSCSPGIGSDSQPVLASHLSPRR